MLPATGLAALAKCGGVSGWICREDSEQIPSPQLWIPDIIRNNDDDGGTKAPGHGPRPDLRAAMVRPGRSTDHVHGVARWRVRSLTARRALCGSAARGQYERHKQLVEDYLRYYKKPDDVLPAQAEAATYRTDKDVLQENWRCGRPQERASRCLPAPPASPKGRGCPLPDATARFVRRPEDDAQDTWEQRLVKRYYDRLYKEYCLADLRHYKKGQVW